MASSTGVKSMDLGKTERRQLNPSTNDFIIPLGKGSAITQDMNKVEDIDSTNKVITRYSHFPPANSAEDEKRGTMNAISGDEDTCRTALEVIDSKPDADAAGGTVGITGYELRSNDNDKQRRAAPVPDYSNDDDDDVPPMLILHYSSHRDGSIYRDIDNCWKRDFGITNRNETPLEAMRFSHSTDCIIRDGICKHTAWNMLQIFSLRLAKIPVEHGSVELYGYIAARDALDSLLNYFINVSRDDPIIVKQGSLIYMSGPKRGILHLDATVIEYDMKIKTGKHENEDLQLIDGVSTVDSADTWDCHPFTDRIHGDCGAIDVTAACIYYAVEATVEVAILQVQGSFNMRLSCFTSGIHKEIRLFNGAIGEPCGLKRFVVAVHVNAQIVLKFKLDADSCLHRCSFKANRHGHDNQEIKTDFALIAVKVTWSTIW
ncbi:unnamed protein product [Miscanthus lutarioriparius]|uniref:DUF6598 domain-containing protein n=1 Tax=Miscanthus lutarioriparius TaxID=422564 RepID=A0A811Q5W2_9POAL|nr:unnamed protein product [Miscanthus lutarioriparius]